MPRNLHKLRRLCKSLFPDRIYRCFFSICDLLFSCFSMKQRRMNITQSLHFTDRCSLFDKFLLCIHDLCRVYRLKFFHKINADTLQFLACSEAFQVIFNGLLLLFSIHTSYAPFGNDTVRFIFIYSFLFLYLYYTQLGAEFPLFLQHYRISLIFSSTTSMSVVGSNRSTTLPFRSIKNFVKFHLISAPFTSIFA